MKAKLFKIFFALVLSFAAVNYVAPQIFIANTPRIRPNLPEYIVWKVQTSVSSGGQYVAKLFTNILNPGAAKQEQELAIQRMNDILSTVPLRSVAKGVSAQTTSNIVSTTYNVDEVEWVEYAFNIKGKEIKIRIPKGDSPPPQDVLEKMY